MPNFLSPGVYVVEKDISDYPPVIDSSIVGIVGFATKGPTNEATLITSRQNLIDTFGRPSEALDGQGLEAALEILEATNQVRYVRATADVSSTNASAIVPMGACPFVGLSAVGDGDSGSGVGHLIGVTSALYLRVQVTDNNGTNQFAQPKQISIPTGSQTTAEALIKAIGTGTQGAKIGATSSLHSSLGVSAGYIFAPFAGSGATLSVSAYSDATYQTTANAISPHHLGNASAGTAGFLASGDEGGAGLGTHKEYGISFRSASGESNSISYTVESLYPGAGYNEGTRSDGTTSGHSIEVIPIGGTQVNIQINEDGAATEQFLCGFVSSTAGSKFIEEAINTGNTNTTSRVIKGNIVTSGVDLTPTALAAWTDSVSALVGVDDITGTWGRDSASRDSHWIFVKPIQGTVSLKSGQNAVGSADENASSLIGSITGGSKTGMQALDDESINISIALVPGISDQNVQNNLITLAESTQDFVAVVAPPYAIGGVAQAIDWHNGSDPTRSAAINSSYAGIYWPWVKVFSVYDGKDIWLDPSIYGARTMVVTDSDTETWFAPAGLRRGRLTKPTDVEVVLNQGDRDALYGGGNAINPIVNFPGDGIVIWGQRTAQRSSTSLDRINVRRLMIYLKKILLATTKRYVFEPNDEFLWSDIEAVVNDLLNDIRTRRGITEFRAIVDETVNTPARIDRNELWAKVLIKPTKTAEVLVFELNLTSQSANITS